MFFTKNDIKFYYKLLTTCMSPFQDGLRLYWKQKVIQHHIKRNVYIICSISTISSNLWICNIGGLGIPILIGIIHSHINHIFQKMHILKHPYLNKVLYWTDWNLQQSLYTTHGSYTGSQEIFKISTILSTFNAKIQSLLCATLAMMSHNMERSVRVETICPFEGIKI
jgi:hypothetical protein